MYNQTNYSKKCRKESVIPKDALKDYLYYLLFRIDSVYYDELKTSIDNFISKYYGDDYE